MGSEADRADPVDSDLPVDGSTIRVSPMSRTGKLIAGTESPDSVHCLTIIDGAQSGRHFILGSTPVVIGRMAPASAVIDDHQISRRHCSLVLEGHEVIVRDLRSTNGCFVQGRRVAESMRLPIGATLRIGQHVLKHEFRRRADVEAEEALWREPMDVPSVLAEPAIQIDEDRRRLEVARIVESDFFRGLTKELEDLRSL